MCFMLSQLLAMLEALCIYYPLTVTPYNLSLYAAAVMDNRGQGRFFLQCLSSLLLWVDFKTESRYYGGEHVVQMHKGPNPDLKHAGEGLEWEKLK